MPALAVLCRKNGGAGSASAAVPGARGQRKRSAYLGSWFMLWPGAVWGEAGTGARPSLDILLPRLPKRSEYYSVRIT